MDSAMAAFCSTMNTVTPFRLMSGDQLGRSGWTRAGGEAHRGLVHQQESGPRHERAAHREHLLLAAGERAPGLLAEPLAQPREEPEHPFEVLREPPADPRG